MLTPLKQFICDECGDIINTPSEGYIEWEEGLDKDGKWFAKGFRIVHHFPASPYKDSRREGCYKYAGSRYRHDIDLEGFLRTAHQQLYSFLNIGFFHDPYETRKCTITDFGEFVDFAKRLTIPYYEEARQYWGQIQGDPDFNDKSDIDLYTEETLKKIVERYS